MFRPIIVATTFAMVALGAGACSFQQALAQTNNSKSKSASEYKFDPQMFDGLSERIDRDMKAKGSRSRQEASADTKVIDDLGKRIKSSGISKPWVRGKGAAKAVTIDPATQARIDELKKAIEREPGNDQNYALLGEIFRNKVHDERTALQYWDKAISLNERSAKYFRIRGGIHLRLGNQELAIRDYTKAIELASDVASAYQGRATAYMNLNNVKLAIGDLERAVALAPKYSRNYEGLALCYLSLGKIDECIAVCTKGVAVDSKRGSLFGLRGDALRARGSWAEAEKDYIRAKALGWQRQ